jgi:APA family basic amino acid/polyamine antiporter
VEQLNLGSLQHPAELYVGLVAAIILFLATNAGLIGLSRLVYSMGIYRQLPDRVRRLHPRFRTPWVGILTFGGVAILTLLPGQADFLGQMYAFGAMLSFTIAHVAVLRLRASQPDFPRPYRGPGNLRVRGYDLPVFALVGASATGTAFVVVTVLNPVIAAAGTAWLVLGIAVYIAYRRRQGLDLTSTHKVVLPKTVTEREAEYESVLVHFDADSAYDAQVIATAAKLAARRRRGIHVLVTIAVPSSSPIDAALGDQEAAARSLIEQARVQGGGRVSGHWEKIRPGQAGRRIIDEARRMRAAAVVMPLPRRVSGGSLFGRTLETVLAERPCRVIIESTPPSARPHARRGEHSGAAS